MKPIRLRFWKVMTVTLLSLLSPLTLSQKGLALNCNSEEVKFLIEDQLKIKLNQKNPVNQEVKNDQLETIKQWGRFLYPELKQEDVMCALVNVLNDQSLPWELRSQAADVLGGIGTAAESAKPYLLIAFNDHYPQVRSSAIIAVRGINADGTVDDLIKALDDPDNYVKRAAASALVSVAKDKKSHNAVDKLINLLKTHPNAFVRQAAGGALVEISAKDTKVLSVLETTLKNDSVWFVRDNIIVALLNEVKEQNIDKSSLQKILDIDVLVSLLQDQNYTLQSSTSELLDYIDIKDKKLFPPLIKILTTIKTDQGNKELRRTVAKTIGNIAKDQVDVNNNNVTQTLIETIQTDPDDFVRANAAEALGKISPYDSSNQKELMKFLEDKNEDIRVSAAIGLTNLATPLQDKYQKSPKIVDELSQAIKDFDSSIQVMQSVSQKEWKDKDKQEKFQQQQDIITRKLNFLKERQNQEWWQNFNSIINKPVVIWIGWFAFIYIVVYWIILFWWFPLLLLKWDENIWKWVSEVDPKVGLLGKGVSSLIILKYHPRVLDRWTEKNLKKVRDDFLHKPTVQHHKIYVPLPVQLDFGDNLTTIERLTSQDLKESFPRHLLIWGESGVGKTSIACQIAQWAMSDNKEERLCKHRILPVLISENIEIDNLGEEKHFLAAIRGQLEAAITEESVSPELLKHLLMQKRILVIVDHLSEMSEATRKLIRPGQPDFPVHALVVTSRQEESLGSVLTIKPSQLTGSQTSTFLETYLVKKGVRQLFTDKELHENCANLSQIVGQRNITPMFVKL